MISQEELQKIKETTEEFLQKMTILDFTVEVKPSLVEIKNIDGNKKEIDGAEVSVAIQEDPQILIGHDGQTLFELEKVLRVILTKKIQKSFYLKLDINNYREKKIEYLKSFARDIANEVAFTKEKKVLSPMPAYQRRVIHTELAERQDIATESQGEGLDRHLVISPK